MYFERRSGIGFSADQPYETTQKMMAAPAGDPTGTDQVA
jgi:hypothetical protein